MNKTFAVPRGTSDILPDAIPLWEALESKARKICKSYGYREIRTPIYEDINLFKRSLGATSDVVHKQLLEMVSSKEEEGYALRPEGTASIVRSYLENSFDKKEPLSKFFYIGPMFRGERPQKGRLRQFHQIGVEAIGTDGASPFLDAEILTLVMHLLQEFHVQGPKLKINSLGSKEDKERISLWLRKEFTKHKNELCEDCQRRYEHNVFRVLDCKNEKCRKIVDSFVQDLPLSDISRGYFEAVQKALKEAGINFEIAPHLVRGLDYYTHTVFEITAEGLGSQDAVGAGGRYAGLLDDLGGNEKTEYGAIGFALGMERILLASGKAQEGPQTIDAFVIETQAEYQFRSFQLLSDLRKNGISATTNFSGGSMKSLMNQANKANARFALIIGDQEFKDETVSVKNMSTSQQETVALSGIIEIMKDKLK
ncbi:MAG: histidine--tRNA ligase [Candidatus Omnitrophica bacterium]|nr:histidine--tRNA ligase [Candidatus Omnitrophota bacterium]MDE2008991.1 histidine--tRNA ligase [Candidatus Omnitrophota bacterium]MDE2214515.1 histidine--tRNA ligase [Candidatus Omnitrophota bacterium]MDE2230833.1 histidine--tRNA ligase [Candidatus Omnitrophota bacterium]